MSKEKEPKRRRRYDAAFKAKLLALIKDGRTVSSVSESFGVSTGVMYNWLSQERKNSIQGKDFEDAEKTALKRRLREMDQERDILKKALSIFSRMT